MVKREIVKINKILLTLLQERSLNINKIVIFGSYAKSKEGEYSDIDIIIVSKDFRDKDIFERVELTRGIHRELVNKIMKPFDIIYCSDEEWENGNSIIINAAKEEGDVIYG